MEQVEWLDESEAHLWRSMIEMSFGLFDKLSATLKEQADITIQDYEVFHLLSQAEDNRLRVGDLSSQMIASRTRLTQRLDTLAERGLLEKVKCPEDGRAVNIVLKPKGRKLLEKLAPTHVAEVRELVFAHLTRAEVKAMGKSTEKLAKAVRK